MGCIDNRSMTATNLSTLTRYRRYPAISIAPRSVPFLWPLTIFLPLPCSQCLATPRASLCRLAHSPVFYRFVCVWTCTPELWLANPRSERLSTCTTRRQHSQEGG
ncbi:hypothetical protein DFP72DRAFT_1162306 [Ephemerocybe angulata]|uniref:Uncharacterized protein n=1 Tax=Ephemerocybe angulata TaxID=980116 RepID=A0A8H6IJZ4_9AGAR|nr:hypothetical protein DFP72DRAFT_1162306 [Tulosesus angulatus]